MVNLLLATLVSTEPTKPATSTNKSDTQKSTTQARKFATECLDLLQILRDELQNEGMPKAMIDNDMVDVEEYARAFLKQIGGDTDTPTTASPSISKKGEAEPLFSSSLSGFQIEGYLKDKPRSEAKVLSPMEGLSPEKQKMEVLPLRSMHKPEPQSMSSPKFCFEANLTFYRPLPDSRNVVACGRGCSSRLLPAFKQTILSIARAIHRRTAECDDEDDE